jgi:hypothetical protein
VATVIDLSQFESFFYLVAVREVFQRMGSIIEHIPGSSGF